MADTAETVFALVRALMDENETPIVFTDPNLFAVCSAAQRDVQTKLAINGSGVFKTNVTYTVAAGATVLPHKTGDTVADPLLVNPLPDDLLVPLKMWERTTTDEEYLEMEDAGDDGFPTDVASGALRYWMWQGGEIRFIGATTQRLVRLLYERALPNLDAPDTWLSIQGSANAIAYLACANAEFSRGQTPFYDRMTVKGNAALEDLLKVHVRRNQRIGYVRAPYGSPV